MESIAYRLVVRIQIVFFNEENRQKENEKQFFAVTFVFSHLFYNKSLSAGSSSNRGVFFFGFAHQAGEKQKV